MGLMHLQGKPSDEEALSVGTALALVVRCHPLLGRGLYLTGGLGMAWHVKGEGDVGRKEW